MAASAAEIEDFLAGPLVTWLSTCVKKPEGLLVYDTFFDGSPINEVLLQIDPEPTQPVPTTSNLHGLGIVASRIKIFHHIIKNIKAIYEEELGQVVVALPDCISLGRSPASRNALEQLRLLLLLLLGCAVQGPTKESFIARIKELTLEAQHDIVECIKQVTDAQSVVLTITDASSLAPDRLYSQLRMLTVERDALFQQWVTDLGQEVPATAGTAGALAGGATTPGADGVESNHLAVELADWKARLRKQRLELDEKTEFVTECKEQLEHLSSVVAKLKSENTDLISEARLCSRYRDELDAMRERADRADKLELETQRYRERLADAEFYRVRVDELRVDNRVLLETRELLESQLAAARCRLDRGLEVEAELVRMKQMNNETVLERDAAKEKIQELIDENLQLQQVAKSVHETSVADLDDSLENDEPNSGDNSLSEQLTNNAQARALKLELENRKLLSAIDALKEHNIQENMHKILELEKDKKKLSLKCEQLHDNFGRVTQQNVELENLFKNAIQENRKLQETLDTGKVVSDRQGQDLQIERSKINELEKNIEVLTKEKQRIQSLCESIKKRADDADKTLSDLKVQRDLLQQQADKCKQLERDKEEITEKNTTLEKENSNVQKEIVKIKELLETKERSLDEQSENCSKLEKEISRLNKEFDNANSQLEKLQEFEQKAQELLSQTAVYTETIATLQKDLISEKVCNEKFKTNLEKLGLNLDILENDINVVLEKMLSNPDLAKNITSLLKEKLGDNNTTIKCLKCMGELNNIESSLLTETEQLVSSIRIEWTQKCEKLTGELATSQQLNESLKTDNAKMQVDIATLTSQVTTLTAQQTALQLANSQLVAEKEELSKQHDIQNKQHDTLLLDQVTIRNLHDQLSIQYETLQSDQEHLKKVNRDMRSEIRTLKDENDTLQRKLATLEQEQNGLRTDSKNLVILRNEHSKLKDDFRNLFTANERLKSEYRGLQDEYRNIRAETGKLRLGNTEMQGELNSRSDVLAGLKLENAQLQQRCDMLFEMNHSLDTDRRALMEHASQLLKQYHSLLTHSLEDTQHYHLEEKLFNDKVNNLCRQKEKLEEKIMEHYRKLDNASAKKKGFGATLVRRVRKAGSDIINKVPSRNRRSWHEDTNNSTLTTSNTPFTPLHSHSPSTLTADSADSTNNDSDTSETADLLKSAAQSPNVAPAHSTITNSSSATLPAVVLLPRITNAAIVDTVNTVTPPPPPINFKRSTIGTLHGQKPRDEVALRKSQRSSAVLAAAAAAAAAAEGHNRNSIASDSTYVRETNSNSSALSLGSVGTRRTVYLSEEIDTPAATSPSPQLPMQAAQAQPPPPPLLVYNRISSVIGDSPPQRNASPGIVASAAMEDTSAHDNPALNDKKKGENAKENAIWYEYGCV